MREVGTSLIVLAVLALICGVAIDTTVASGNGDRAHNLGLMQQREIVVLVALSVFISGVILVAAGIAQAQLKRIADLLTAEQPKSAVDESVTAEAVTESCRSCDRDNSHLRLVSGTTFQCDLCGAKYKFNLLGQRRAVTP